MTATQPFRAVFSQALRGQPCEVSGWGQSTRPLPVADWSRSADHSDRSLLAHCRGATLDVGCGPGRMAAHLRTRGHHVLGLDIVDEAVAQARRRGVAALRRDVFAPLPGEGAWDTVLLADGNIGIGGDPSRLLRRAAELVGAAGRVVCDLAVPGTGLHVGEARLVVQGVSTPSFRWAHVGPEALFALATGAGLSVRSVQQDEGRWIGVLTR